MMDRTARATPAARMRASKHAWEGVSRLRERGAHFWSNEKVDGHPRHDKVGHEAEVKPLPNLRMKVTTRPVVRGRGRQPQPQLLTPRLNVVHAWAARAAMLCCCEDQVAAPASNAPPHGQLFFRPVQMRASDLLHQWLHRCSSASKHRPTTTWTSLAPPARGLLCHWTPATAARQPAGHSKPRSGQREPERWPVERAAPCQLWQNKRPLPKFVRLVRDLVSETFAGVFLEP